MHADDKFSLPRNTAKPQEHVTMIETRVQNLYQFTNFYLLIVSTGFFRPPLGHR